MNDDKMESCPFCGNDISNYEIYVTHGFIDGLHVHCDVCNYDMEIEVPRYYVDNVLIQQGNSAIDVWNRRVKKELDGK